MRPANAPQKPSPTFAGGRRLVGIARRDLYHFTIDYRAITAIGVVAQYSLICINL
jgi:hypothetical protein